MSNEEIQRRMKVLQKTHQTGHLSRLHPASKNA